jgi:hypothetical protein
VITIREILPKLFLGLILTLISLPFTFVQAAHSEITPLPDGKSLIIISDLPNRDTDGSFFDRSLEARLSDAGSLGRLLNDASKVPASKRKFAIDPMLIEEVQDLADGFRATDGTEVPGSPNAQRWLERLNIVLGTSEVACLNYGSPNVSWLSKAAPSELRIHHRLSVELLQSLLQRPVSTIPPEINGQVASIDSSIADRYTQMRRAIRSINQYANNPRTISYRLRIGAILNPIVPKDRVLELTRTLQREISSYQDSIRISKGRFTLTSSSERVPITLINDFDNPLQIRLKIKSTNSKVIVESPDPILVDANSKLSVEVPVTVLASGQSELLITMRTNGGINVGDQVRLPLTLTVISPFTTWITTGSGLVLLIAAVIQSMRRVKRSRKSKSESAEVGKHE